ncbi:GHKL domain-containing protein [Actinomyces culturomici]|uniref:GHKL domain-containing protein n=1 Tax=Actinomyces culturomici TaxID=1926276 RepID=UPI000E1FD8CF|nr:GHKL domain-containing protein [Actinomyces culturomici]
MFEPLPDIPRLYTGIAEWGAALLYVLLATRTRPRMRLVLGALASLAGLVGVQLLAGVLPVSMWIPGMLAAVLAIAASIRGTSGLGRVATWHLTFRAFILAEFLASLEWQLQVYFLEERATYAPGGLVFMVLVYVLVLAVWGALENRNFSGEEPLSLGNPDLWMGLLISLTTFAMSNLSFLSTSTPFSGRLGPEVFYIRTLVDLCGLAALYAQHERIMQIRTSTELASIHATLDAQHLQYLQSKADFEALGRAHHDLKHQIAVIRAEVDPEAKRSDFEELEESVNALGHRYHSGNPVLDVVLSAKASACDADGIDFTAVADGKLLERMSAMDIATLFGNALDNAIEASRRVADPDHRLVKLALHSRGEMTVIRVENWYSGLVATDETGNLRTTKSDRSRHGFGVKSIRWTARKYGGEVSTHFDGQWFTLTVLLPSASPIEA